MAHIKTTKTDPVRPVLAALINETQTPYTPDNIIREFRATDDKRRPERELLLLLESISFKRAKYREVLNEIETILERKDPMYALIVFAERISAKPLSSKRAQKSSSLNDIHVNMPLPTPPTSLSKSSSGAKANMDTTTTNASITLNNNNDRQPPMMAPPPASLTSTPLTTRSSDERNKELSSFGASTIFGARAPYDSRSDLSQIKRRVLNAVSNGSDEKYDRIMKHKQVIYRAAIPEASNDSTETNNATITNTSVDPVVPSTSAQCAQTNGSNGACSALVEVPPYPVCPAFKTEKNNNDLVQYKEGLPDEDRVNVLWDFNDMDAQNTLPERKLNALPLNAQENVLVEDVLYVLVGVRGSYIRPMPREDNGDGYSKYETRFALHSEMDKSLAELIKEILPLASHYIGIQLAIANTSGRGQVISALNAHLTTYTKEYYNVIASAEEEHALGHMTLAKLEYYLQPTTWIMSAIYNFVIEMQMNDCQGAAVLSLLDKHIKRLGGDKRPQGALIELATATAAPYMKMLQNWIQKGIIVDRTGEFLVEDNEVIHMGELPEHYSDDYWERRYTVREKSIPKFLAGLADKILRTGKYLNVIRQCGKREMPVQTMNLEYDPTNDKLVSVINDAYHFAARMLLDVLLTENDLMGHLLSVKRYLLLHQGDFIMQFMDASEDELSKNVDQVLPITLDNLLGLTLRLSSARGDPYKDNVHCGLLTYDLVTQMSKIIKPHEETWKSNDRLDLSGMECFAFSYEVKWPVSLVLNHIAISKYQMLFRQLFYCKHVERQLCKIWKENSLTKKFSPQSAKLYRSAFTLRQRMMNAIQNLEYYMMIEIIEPNWHVFIEKMKKVENVDMVLKLHHDFLDLCLKNCMLSETSHLNRAIFKLCKICLKFCEFIQRSQRFFLDAELKSMVCDSGDENTDQSDTEPDISDRLQTESKMDESDTFGERVKRFDLEFTGMLITFLKQINDLAKDNTTDLFMNLVHRINFNGFYSDQMEKLCVSKAMG